MPSNSPGGGKRQLLARLDLSVAGADPLVDVMPDSFTLQVAGQHVVAIGVEDHLPVGLAGFGQS